MKTLKTMISVVIVVAFALSTGLGVAMAVSVTISGAVNATYTLNYMSIDSNGNITLDVSGTNPPPPGALTLSLSPATLPTGTVGTAYSQTVTMTASGGTSPYNYACSGSGVTGITASNNGNICTISGTPTAPGTYTVTFSVTDSATASAASASSSISFNVNSGGGGSTDGGILLPSQFPATSGDQSIDVGGVAKYYFKLDSDISKAVVVYLSSSDWSTDQDIVVSKNGYVTSVICDRAAGYYCGATPGRNNETVAMYPTTGKAGDTFYITVFNKSDTTGKYIVYWQAY